jgi:glucose-1-phosphate cytidylyltransferase
MRNSVGSAAIPDRNRRRKTMKVVLFCGGLGMRIREYSEAVPKPMVPIGDKPILWHVMKYYAHFGHKDFILCLGYKGESIKQYFQSHSDSARSNGDKEAGMDNWRVTLVDTGIAANVGQRLKAVEPHLKGEEIFLANYADGLTDLPLPAYLDHFLQRKKIASFLCVRPNQSFHVVTSLAGDLVKGIECVDRSNVWINGGFFIFRKEIFNYINDGEDLVDAPFQKLIKEEELLAYKCAGFWAAMDTFKERQRLEDICASGNAPWEVWKSAKQGA